MSGLLINEPPLQVLPTLAEHIGLNEAIVLQQIHYWIRNPKIGKEHDGKRWVYNSIREWKETNFPFWSDATVRRTLESLEEMGLILSENLNPKTYDRTLWYTIDYEELARLDDAILSSCTNGIVQDDKIDLPKVSEPIPETTIENTDTNGGDEEPILELAKYFSQITGKPLPDNWHSKYAQDKWLKWLVYIYRQHGSDFRETKRAMYAAVEYANENGLVLATPYSIRNLATAGKQDHSGYRDENGDIVVSTR